jgi:eukaryotic-like serine/threonine-protein kinase
VEYQGQIVHDRYEIGAPIGEGREARVYRALDRHLDREVAIKVLRPELRNDPTFATRFEREARSVARLIHPHIVPVYDYGQGLDTSYLVMQYLEGGDLRRLLVAGQPLELGLALRLSQEIADALAAAHRIGIVHRDVKPGNVLLTSDREAKVTDFGIAKLLEAPGLTARTDILGSAYYLSPEQAAGTTITPAADVYSLGVVLFEMLAGRRPFEGESFIQVTLQHVQTPPPPITDFNPAVPADLAALIERMLAKDPAARFPDGAALLAALRAVPLAPPDAHTVARSEPEYMPISPRDDRVDSPLEARGSEPRQPVPIGATAPGIRSAGPGPDSWGAPLSAAHPAPEQGTANTGAVLEDTAPWSPGEITPSYAPWSGAAPPGNAPWPATPPGGGGVGGEWRAPGAAGGPRRRDPSVIPIVVLLLIGLAMVVAIASVALFGGQRRTAQSGAGLPILTTTPAATEGRAGATDDASAAGAAAASNPEVAGASTPVPTAPSTQAPAAPASAPAAAPTAAPTEAPTSVPPTAVPASRPAPSTSAAAETGPPPAAGGMVLDDDAFQGGYSAPRNYRGRTARWLYGANSQYGQMTATFTLDGQPTAGKLVISGIDSENGGKTPIAILINDTVIYQGGNPLPKDDWRGPTAPWGTASFPIPAGVLKAGRNTLTFKNLSPTANFDAPPYFMLDQATITYDS